MKLGDYNWFMAEVKFKVNNKPVSFNIAHNMNEETFMAALESWQSRTTDFTDTSFCDYVTSKGTERIAFTEKEYNSLNKTKK